MKLKPSCYSIRIEINQIGDGSSKKRCMYLLPVCQTDVLQWAQTAVERGAFEIRNQIRLANAKHNRVAALADTEHEAPNKKPGKM